jgi:pimeloyl-ACP methyl ester carboxylesterase
VTVGSPMSADAGFDIAGPAGAPAILLVHGSVVTRVIWQPQLRALSDRFTVIAPDLPGHGALAAVPFTFDNSVDTLVRIVETHARGRALVVGLSLGGYVAIELARQHPGRVAGLVLSGSSLNFRGALGTYLSVVSWLMRRGWLTQSRARAEQKTRRIFPPALADVAEAQITAGVYPDALGPAFAEMAHTDFSGHLAEYSGPTLILNGANDSASRRGAQHFVDAAQDGRLQVLADAGHACNLDQPDAFTQAVRDFARSTGWGD